MRINGESIDVIIERCKRVDLNEWEVKKPIYVRGFPFYGFGIVFRRRIKPLNELEKKHIELSTIGETP